MKKKLLLTTLLTVVALSLCTLSFAQEEMNAEKKEGILSILEHSKLNEMLDQISQNPMMGESIDTTKLSEKIIKLYDENFTDQEIKEMNDFLTSETGKKMMEFSPKIGMAINEFFMELQSQMMPPEQQMEAPAEETAK